MRYLLTPALSSRVLHPTAFRCVSSQSTRRVMTPRTEYLVGIAAGRQQQGVVGSFVSLSNRNYGVDRSRREEKKRQPVRREKNQDTILESIALNRKITELGKKGEWREILLLAEKEKNRFDSVNWSSAFSKVGGARELDRHDPGFESFVEEYADLLESKGLQWGGIREVASAVHTIGKIRLRNPATKKILLFVSRRDNARSMVRSGDPQAVANLAWAFAKVDAPSPEIFEAIDSRANWLVQNGTPQNVANTAWACAKLKLGESAPELFEEIEAQADWLVINGNPQAISNTAWAFARVIGKGDAQVPFPEKLFKAIEDHADWLATNGNTHDVANIAWACAKLGIPAPKFFSAIEEDAERLVKQGSKLHHAKQHLATIAWACATLNANCPDLFAAMEESTR